MTDEVKFFDESKYDNIDEKKLFDIDLEKEIHSLLLLKRMYNKTLDDIDTQLIRFREEMRKRNEEKKKHEVW